MLARTIAWVGGCLLMWSIACVHAEKKQPNVFVFFVGDRPDENGYQKALEVLNEGALAKEDQPGGLGWRSSQGKCRSNSRWAMLPAVLYGKQPLINGVASYENWRRIPATSATTGSSIARVYQDAGYHTAFYGGWNMGKTAPHDSKSRGFDVAYDVVNSTPADKWGQLGHSGAPMKLASESVLNAIRGEKPVFAVFSQSPYLASGKLSALLKTEALSEMEKTQRSTIILMLYNNPTKAKGGDQGPKFHSPVDWNFYHYGNKPGYLLGNLAMVACKTDWEVHFALKKMIGGGDNEKIDFRFFHNSHWPVNDSLDKFRHRGSLVVGKGYALVNGLELYAANKNLEPDYTQVLDIAEHQKLHSELLTAHSRWWQQARMSLHDPRAFFVGVEDKKPTRLNVLNWRPSKIVHPDGTAPMFKPLKSQKDLLGILKGMQGEDYRRSFPSYSGSWAIDVKRPGRYKITASMLPPDANKPEEKQLAKLQGGRAFVRLGRNKVEFNLLKGATSVSVLVDADAGVTDLECWFTGQLALERELGAFFVEIERVGDKKFDLKAKE